MLAATRMMLDGVARARQLAISQHTTVYMVFAPKDFWADTALYNAVYNANLTQADKDAVTNLLEKQLTGFAFVSLRSIADQPGQPTAKYLTSWQTLPDKAFIAEWKFNLSIVNSNVIPDGNGGAPFQVCGFNTATNIPFPRAETKLYTAARPYVALPYIAFDYTGQLISALPNADGEFIPLAHGSVSPVFDKATRRPVFATPSVQEQPPGNSGPGTAYNLIHIDKFTGRARLEHQKVK